MIKVAVAMSTYNGEKYLKEQLDSLFEQKKVDLTLFVRDDLSTDKTVEILSQYNGKLIRVDNNSTNLGVGCSFMETLYRVGTDFDYFAFCDQDDVWEKDKLICAIEKLGNTNKPRLYNSNQELVDENLKTLGMRHKIKLNTSSLQILSNNKITGCTMVWNQALQKLLLDIKRRPSAELLNIRIHDVWVSMVASAVGDIIYDENSKIKYRQHANNVVGVRVEKKRDIWLKKLQNSLKRRGRSKLATEILANYGDLISPELQSQLDIYSNYDKNFKKKWILLTDWSLSACSMEPKFQLCLKILLNLV